MTKDKVLKKYHLTHKNEGTWIKWSVVDEKNIVRYVGLYKGAKEWIKKHTTIKKDKSVRGDIRTIWI